MDELEYYRDEVRRLTARLNEIKSSWSYRISSPIRLVERSIHSFRKRSLSANLKKMKASAEHGLFGSASDDKAWSYSRWVRLFDTIDQSDADLIRGDIERFARRPMLTVVILPNGGGAGSLQWTVESLSRQLYREFEIIVADMGIDSAAVAAWGLADVPVRSAGVTTDSAADIFNAGLAMASGELLMAIEAGDALSPHALYLAARAVVDEPGAEVIYGDDDELTPGGERANPFFKPDWSPELCLAFNYVGKAVVFRTTRLRLLGGARPVAGDAWRWDLVLRAADSLQRPCAAGAIHHVPVVLVHQGSRSSDRRRREVAAGQAVVAEALARRNTMATLSADEHGWFSIRRRLPSTPPHVTIIMPTRDRCDLLRKCVNGILTRTNYPSFDVVIVNNRSQEPETFQYFAELEGDSRVRIVPYVAEFNYAQLHNEIVPLARGEILAFLNNDLDVIGANWLEAMVGYALEEDVGAVGAKLYYPDDTIQHASVVLGIGGTAAHMYGGRLRSEPGPHGLMMVAQEVSAVTGACLVLRRSVFIEVGGLDERFAVDFNDIDLCLRLRERGYRIVWVAEAELYHHESATRGNYHFLPDTPEHEAKRERYQREVGLFRDKWSKLLDNDPFYNPNLTLGDGSRSLAFPSRAGRYWKRRMLDTGAARR